MIDHSLLDDFIVESGEHLEETERNLLRLEQQPNDALVLNEIFRSIHTIKGSAEYLGLERIADLTHKLESFLDLLRRGERVLDSHGIDLLIGANDRIAQLVDDLSRHRSERAPINDLLSRIEGLTGTSEPISAEYATGENELENDCEAFDDEYDEELFGIFVGQLKDGLEGLWAETQNLRAPSVDAEPVLARYEDRLNTLSASANYMGYDKLKQVYVRWAEALSGTRKRFSESNEIDWEVFTRDVTVHYIGCVKGLFPKVTELQSLEQFLNVSEQIVQPQSPPEKDPEADQPMVSGDIGADAMAQPISAVDTPLQTMQTELELFSDTEDVPADTRIKIDRTLLDDFIAESAEHLEETERNLLRLELKPDDALVLNEIFRSIHTIKGSAEYLGLERISELTHKLESFLELLRRGERVVDSRGIDLLIGANDRIAQLVDDLSRHASERASIDDLVARIDGFSHQADPVSGEKVIEDIDPEPDCEAFEDEYDEELFSIFASQLKDGLETLWEETQNMCSASDPEPGLARYEDRLNTLSASANYMGYDKLKQLYVQWSEAVTAAGTRLSKTGTVDWEVFAREVTAHYIDRVKGLFPNVDALASLAQIPPEQVIAPIQTVLETIEENAENIENTEDTNNVASLDGNHDLYDDFIVEAREHLEEVERNLIHLTDHPDHVDILKELFRSIHTIKGSSEYLGFARIAALSHKLENVLDLLRRGDRSVDAGITNLLMDSSDRIGTLVSDLVQHQKEQTAIDDLVVRIDEFVETPQIGTSGTATPPIEEPPVMAPASPAVESPEFEFAESASLEPDLPEPISAQANPQEPAFQEFAFQEPAFQEPVIPEPGVLEPDPSVPERPQPMHPEPSGGTQDVRPAAIVYKETYDTQLFAIFLAQFNEGLTQLAMESEQLAPGASFKDVTARCKALLGRLRFSANYMEYDALKAAYDGWNQALDALCAQLPTQDEPTWIDSFGRLMQRHVEQVQQYFQPADMASTLQAPTQTQEQPQEQAQEQAQEQEQAREQAAEPDAILDDVPEASNEMQGEDFAPELDTFNAPDILEDVGYLDAEWSDNAVGSSDEERLLSRLEMAFDEKMGPAGDRDASSHREIVDALFSDNQAFDGPPRRSIGKAAEGSDIVESLLFSALGSDKAPRPPVIPKPLARMNDQPDLPVSFNQMEEDDQRTPYAIGRRRGDKFHERPVKQSIRVDAAKIDILMNQVGELVVTRAGFNQLFSDMRDFQLLLKQTRKFNTPEMQIVKDLTNRINEATVSLGRVTSELQENVMKVRMLPIAQLFSRYPRVVHDLLRNSEKKLELVIRGEETELDRMVIEQIADPLVHIIRNAVDHGIEVEAERLRKGKPASGTLRLEAYHEGNYVVIEVSDDGRGIDPRQIKARALTKGFVAIEDLDNMSDDQVRAIIMRPGFSTVDEVTHTSGRGVGMDVVKDNIEKLNGTIEILSTPDRGTLFRIRIPLTLAIIQALKVGVAGETFIIPLSAVDETLRIHRNEISMIEGIEIYYLRETTLPLIRLTQIFRMQETRHDNQELFVVVVNTGSRQVGLVVDQLQGRQEVVIKPLEDYLQVKSGFSGATILGDGSISLILDVADLVHLAIGLHTRKMKAVSA